MAPAPWYKRLLFRQAKGMPGDAEAANDVAAAPQSKILPPSQYITRRQAIRAFLINAIGAFIISGGINLAIAYAMYHDASGPVRLFRFPNTLAGDAAVTIFVQTVITWLITSGSTNADVRNGLIEPIGFVAEPNNKALRWYCYLDAEQPVRRRNVRQWFVFLGAQIARGLLTGVFLFLVFWPIAVAIMTFGDRRDGDVYYPRVWTPEIFKLLLGGILGFVQTPAISAFWLIAIGWRVQREHAALDRVVAQGLVTPAEVAAKKQERALDAVDRPPHTAGTGAGAESVSTETESTSQGSASPVREKAAPLGVAATAAAAAAAASHAHADRPLTSSLSIAHADAVLPPIDGRKTLQ